MLRLTLTAGLAPTDWGGCWQRCSTALCLLPRRPAGGGEAADVSPGPDSGLNVRTRVQVGEGLDLALCGSTAGAGEACVPVCMAVP